MAKKQKTKNGKRRMRPGGGKAKGASFERQVCKELSLWITDGKRTDCFWRSAMSGGRATVASKKGVDVRQAGDITAVAPEGTELTDKWFIECKHVKTLVLDSFLVKGTGLLAKFWKKCCKEAERHGRLPIIIARQNKWPTLIITNRGTLIDWTAPFIRSRRCDITLFHKLTGVRYM